MNKDITLTIDENNIFLQATYECTIYRHENSDDHRKWWEPELEAALIRVDFTNKNDEEFEWFYGDAQPSPIMHALELYEGRLEQMLADKVKEIINDFNFQNDPHEGEPRDD